jgi:thioredoxin-dependent peroxiredoxin
MLSMLRALFTSSTLLAAGTVAPPFVAPDQSGVPVSLAGYRGKWVVLFFYPQALTPG